MDVVQHNSMAWDRQVDEKNRWTVPVSRAEIEQARLGKWSVVLTPCKPVPGEWFPDLKDKKLLCLASGGGQQGPVFAAAGARVTVFDNSAKQLRQDRLVAERESLIIETVQGDMQDLREFADQTFDLIFHPVSNVFVSDIQRVWNEAFRVLKPGGVLLSGFMNPAYYIFDPYLAESKGLLNVKYRLPYADEDSLPEAEKERYRKQGIPFEFSHTWEDQIGGQIKAGFLISGFYEDTFPAEDNEPISRHMAACMATRALKP